MIFMVRTTIVLATLPVVNTGKAGQDVWLAALMVMAGTALFALLMAGLSSRFPDLTVVEYSRLLLGRYLGGLVALDFLWIYLHISISHIRVYSEIIIGVFLTETPLTFIIATMVLLAVFAVYHGVEVIGRLADALLPVFAAFVALSLIGALTAVEGNNLQPVLARGLSPAISGAITPIALGAQFITLGMLAPHIGRPERLVPATLLVVALSGATILLTSTIVVGVLGPELAENSVFPAVNMIKTVAITKFLERIEVLTMLAWGFGLMIDVSALFYCGVKGMSQFLGIKEHRTIIVPMAIIWVLLTQYAFKDLFMLMAFYKPGVIFPYIMVAVVMPYLVLWAAYIVRKHLGLLPGREGGRQSG